MDEPTRRLRRFVARDGFTLVEVAVLVTWILGTVFLEITAGAVVEPGSRAGEIARSALWGGFLAGPPILGTVLVAHAGYDLWRIRRTGEWWPDRAATKGHRVWRGLETTGALGYFGLLALASGPFLLYLFGGDGMYGMVFVAVFFFLVAHTFWIGGVVLLVLLRVGGTAVYRVGSLLYPTAA